MTRDELKNNPDLWKLSCQNCQDEFKFTCFLSFNRCLKNVNKGIRFFCRRCANASKRGRPNPKGKFSKNPDDWVLRCSVCDIEMKYKSLATFREAFNREIKKCHSCCQIGKEISDEFRKKCSVRMSNMSIEEREHRKQCARKKYESLSDNEKLERKIKKREAHQKIWRDRSDEENAEIIKKFREGSLNLSEEKRIKRNQKISEKIRDRMKDGLYEGFTPAYNLRTIEYINEILNIKFETQFKHAEVEGGEFKIYDKELKSWYYADAFCEKLNLWIEFDESYKFRKNLLTQKHIERHERIKIITNYNIIRFRLKKLPNGEFIYYEYYNDLTNNTSLTQEIKI